MLEDRAIVRLPNTAIHPHNRGTNWLLVIGIDKYTDPAVPKLSNAVLDTERLTQILTQNYGFQLFNAPLHDEKATRTAILEAIEELEKVLKKDDNLVVFFSGHGYRKSKSGFIVPSDGRNDRTTDYISFVDLNARIDELPMHHFLFILDCCFAGVALKNLGEKRELGKPSRRILAASSSDETAEDGFYGRNSPFTSALAEILEDNKGAELPVKDLHVHLRNLMNAKGVRQVPVEGSWKMDSNRDGEFIFLKQNLEEEAWAALDKNNKTDLLAFAKMYPLSKNAAEALVLVQNIEENEAEAQRIAAEQEADKAHSELWEKFKKQNKADVYLDFWNNYIDSPYRAEARKLFAIAEDNEFWTEKSKTLSGMLDYLERYPEKGLHSKEAKEALKPKPKPQPKFETEPKPTPPPVVIHTTLPKVEPKPIVEKKEEKPKPVVNQSVTDNTDDPSFFQKFKMPLVGGGGLLVAFLIWVGVNTPSVNTPFSEPEMVQVQGGTFKMGQSDPNIYCEGCSKDEQPIHSVTLSNFSIGKFEVTQAQWQSVMGNNPSKFTCSDCPVEQVSWDDIQEFLKKLNAKTGKTFRMPTEAEWEFAARGGNQSKNYTYSGSKDLKSVAWFTENSESKTHQVGQKQANELGIYDMSGNVWEWCSDWYDENYYKNSPAQNPKGPQSGSSRVLRGGSWFIIDYICRSSLRLRNVPSIRYFSYGFRLARD